MPRPAQPGERTRVLLALPSLNGGGAERMALHVAQHLDREQFEPRVWLMHRSGPYLDALDPALLEPSAIGQRFLDFDSGTNAESYRLTRLLPGLVLAPINLAQAIRRFRPHVVLSFRKGMILCTTAAMALLGRRRPPWVAREGNNTLAVIDDELAAPLARAAVRRAVRLSYHSADRVLAISQSLADALHRQLGVPAERLSVIYNAVDTALVQRRAAEPVDLPHGEPFLIAVARLERQKGHDVLLRAFAASQAARRLRLVILGEGSQRQALEQLAAELGLGERLWLPGFVENPWAYVARAAAMVLPARWEGFGNVVIEALAVDTPVIVTDCDYGPREIVRHEESGLIVPVDDVEALRAAIDRLVGDEALRARLVARGRARAREFDVGEIVARYGRLLQEVAEQGGRAAVAGRPPR